MRMRRRRTTIGTGSAGASGHPSKPPAVVSDCPHSMPEANYHVYECAGFAVGVSDEPSANPPPDPEFDLQALRVGFEEGLQAQRARHDARVVVRPISSPIEGREIHGVSVMAVDRDNANEVYSTNYAVIVGRRSIVCSTSLDMGRKKCTQVIHDFVETAP